MQNLQTFNFNQSQVRTVLIDEEPFFVGKDVALVLGYRDTSDALKKHVDEEDKGVGEMPTPGGIQKMQLINESGLYSLVLSSKLPQAKTFKRWVTSEVLPTIRKNGGYNMPKTFAEALRQLANSEEEKERLALENSQMKPKALFADAVSTSEQSILIGELAKLIKQNGIDIGQNRLFDWLRENDYLIKSGQRRNQPTQRAMDLGLFEVKERTINNPDGSVRITFTTKVTGKGQVYFVNKFVGKAA